MSRPDLHYRHQDAPPLCVICLLFSVQDILLVTYH